MSARALVGAALLAGSWLGLRHPALQRADVRAGDALREAGTPALDQAVTHTTDLGSVYAVSGMAAVLAASGRRRLALDTLAAGLAAWTVAQTSKTRVGRQRPYEAEGTRRLIRPPTGSSFPSGHAAVGAAVAAVMVDHARGRAGRLLWHAVGAYVPLSRVYVGVHYPTDVAGGAGMGLLVAEALRLVSGSGRGPSGRRARAPRGRSRG